MAPQADAAALTVYSRKGRRTVNHGNACAEFFQESTQAALWGTRWRGAGRAEGDQLGGQWLCGLADHLGDTVTRLQALQGVFLGHTRWAGVMGCGAACITPSPDTP